MFTLSDWAIYGDEGLINAIKSGWDIDGKVLDETVFGVLEDYIVSYEYEDFGDCGRWDIGQQIILRFEDDEKFYRFWRTVGLTEMQETYFETQRAECVEQRPITIYEWVEVR